MAEAPVSRMRGHPAFAALAGVVAAGAALATGELPSAVRGRGPSLVSAVGDRFVDRFAGALKDVAVALFGTGDKVALVAGIVVVSLALGGLLGVVGRRRPALAAGGFALAGVAGWAALASDTGTSPFTAAVPVVLAVGVGVGVLQILLRRLPSGTPGPGVAPEGWSSVDDPAVRTPDRRSFLAATGVVGAASVAVAGGGWFLRGRSAVEAERVALQLPPAARRIEVPAASFDRIDGVSSYITPNDRFYRIDTALLTPRVRAASWRLRVTGLVERQVELTLDDLLAMELVDAPVTIACVSNEVGGDLVGNAVWRGVPLSALLSRAGLREDATQVVGRSVDGFTAGFPTANALDGRTALVAIGMNGEPLPIRHGYPARLIVAGLYGYVSATKWLTEIELTRFEDFDAYWVPRGWSKVAPVKTQSRIDVPRAGATILPGSAAVAGVAWAPHTGIAAVEVRVDDGPWVPAELGPSANDDTWVQWLHRWDAVPGRHRLTVRATDHSGVPQTVQRRPPRPDGATGHHEIAVTVRG